MLRPIPDARPVISWRGCALAGIVLAPYPSVLLPFQTALWVQGGIVSGILALLLAVGIKAVPEAARNAPRAVRWGLSLYAGAAVFGGLVGVLSGNPLRYVATQLASMLLIPVAFLAFATTGPLRGEEMVGGLGLAGVIALMVHLLAFVAPATLLPPSGEPVRFALRNDVGMSGAAVLGVISALAWWWTTRRLVAGIAALTLGALVAGSMSRGAWLAAGLGVALWVGVSGRARQRVVTRIVLLALGVALTLGVSASLVGEIPAWSTEPDLVKADVPRGADGSPWRDAMVASTPASSDAWVTLVEGPAEKVHGIEIDAWLQGEPGQHAIVSLVSTAGGGDEKLSEFTSGYPGEGTWVPVHLVKRIPVEARNLRLRLWTTGGTWLVGTIQVRVMHATPAVWVRALWLRVRSVFAPLHGPGADGTMQYRLREWRAVRAAWSRADVGRLLAGHGLGAMFAFENSGWDETGARTVLPMASYIHNYYVFLAFKLGLAGVAALVGIALIVAWTTRAALRVRGAADSGWFIGAAAAAWLSYLVWSLTSPEILDFRVAPLWGALIAATLAAARRETTTDAGEPPHVGSEGIDTPSPTATIATDDR